MLNKFKVFIIFILCVKGISGATLITDDSNNDAKHDNLSSSPIEHICPKSMTNKYEQTLILAKPDAVQRKLVGKIIDRFENRGLELAGLKLVLATRHMVEEHYSQHINQTFIDELIEFMTSGPVVAMIWEGPNAVRVTRNMLGNYRPQVSEAGTIRGDFSLDIMRNVIHGSDSIEMAHKEICIWFQKNEMIPQI